MIKKNIILFVLIGLLLNLSLLQSTTLANSKEDKHTAKIKVAILKLGTGVDARVFLKLRDKTELRGYVSESSDGDFKIVSEKDKSTTNVTYAQVKQIKGNNLSTGVKIAIGLGVLLALIVFAALATDGV